MAGQLIPIGAFEITQFLTFSFGRTSGADNRSTGGRVTLLRREAFAQLLKLLVSSDGRHIAFARGQIDSNVWMVSGF